MKDLTTKLFGKATHFFSVIEFQKRGMPHAHIVIKFDGQSPEARHEVENGSGQICRMRGLQVENCVKK